MRVKETRIECYKFHQYPNLSFHSGKFWYNEIEVKEIYNNGSISLLINGIKKGKTKLLNQLRQPKNYYKCTIVIDECPF
jgi:hypothetical protein